jgi:hypothetical protein
VYEKEGKTGEDVLPRKCHTAFFFKLYGAADPLTTLVGSANPLLFQLSGTADPLPKIVPYVLIK